MPPTALDLRGKRFGRLVAKSRAKDGRWRCVCDCGSRVVVFRGALRNGHTRSCGCLRDEVVTETGHANASHGMSRTAEYRAWNAMNQRCTNENHPQYERYGGRGIHVCRRWRRFEHFIEDMGARPSPKHQLRRKNENRGYMPSNCYWREPKKESTDG